MLIIRLIFRLIGFLSIVVLMLPLVLLIITFSQKVNKRKLNKKTINIWSKTLCFVCGLKLTTKGKVLSNPVLIVANHVTWLDIPVIHCYKLVGFVAKAEIAKWPILNIVAKCGESLFITRGRQESRKEVLEGIKIRLKNGRSIAIFPEGKATDGKTLERFHRQLIHAAIEEQKPIQALAIKYINKQGRRNEQIPFKKGENFIKNIVRILSLPPSTVEVTFCTPIETINISARKAAEKSHSQVAEVLALNDYL